MFGQIIVNYLYIQIRSCKGDLNAACDSHNLKYSLAEQCDQVLPESDLSHPLRAKPKKIISAATTGRFINFDPIIS